jgi:predicted nucleic acid-binding Zn ribbon protein
MEVRAVVQTQYKCSHLICNACHCRWRREGNGTCPTCRAPAKHPLRTRNETVLTFHVRDQVLYFTEDEIRAVVRLEERERELFFRSVTAAVNRVEDP